MKISEILSETASCGGTGASSISTSIVTNHLSKGQLFGGDMANSIYDTIHKNRMIRKKKKQSKKI
jgi:hypothetical protein